MGKFLPSVSLIQICRDQDPIFDLTINLQKFKCYSQIKMFTLLLVPK